MELAEFLVWLTSGGSIIAVSWLAEKSMWFQGLSKERKEYFIYAASVILSLGAYGVSTYVPAEVLAQIAPIFAILASSFASIFLGRFYHSLKKPSPLG